VITLVNSSGLRIAGYLLAAVAACTAGTREARARTVRSDSWPGFWFLAAGILLAMALARWADLGGLIPDWGRRSARSGGWYYRRRELQAAAIIALGAAAVGAMAIAIRWLPPNRRRYLPEVIAVLGLAAFAAVRLVSLHQVDALLYRRRVEGVKLDAAVELAGLALAIFVPFWHPARLRAIASAR